MKKLEPREYALFLLKLRDRSVGEIEDKMKKKSFDPEAISDTISFLMNKNLLNDTRFANDFVRMRMTGKPHGKHWFEQKLYEKKINQDIINKVLQDFSSSEAIIMSAERWMKRHAGVNQNELYSKLAPYLVRQGFDYEEVKGVINHIKNNN